jgi:hypothetical protein
VAKAKPFIPCTPLDLPRHLWITSAAKAIRINPANRPLITAPMAQMGMTLQPEHLALLTTNYWGAKGVQLTVGFLDNPPADLRARILSHMNAWNKTANVQFVETDTDPQVRIARLPGQGYSSYIGTDILDVPSDQPTMNLEGFTMNTPDSEFFRVVRHETGHTLGFVHEHMRKELVDRIDPDKAYAYFGGPPNNWSKAEVDQNVLTPIDESQLTATPDADQDSIMCYQLPGSITVDGQPITGGVDIDDADYALAASLYPQTLSPQAPTLAPLPRARQIGNGQISLEDFIEASSRAGLRGLQPQPLPPGVAVKPPPGRIFIGIVAAEE